MKVLILSGRFGMGHNSAAKALLEELQKIESDATVDIVDLIEYMMPSASELIYKGFTKVVDKYPEIYNMLYKLSEKIAIDVKLPGSKTNKKMRALLDSYQPDIIISTIPVCASTISAYKQNQNIEIPLITCITDISLHTEWIAPNTDIYLVPTGKIKENLVENGIQSNRIFVVGIPVKQAFKKLENHRQDQENKNILIMGGGLGILPNLDTIMKELEKMPNLSTTIITGTNKEAFNKLQGKYKNAEIVGFTDKVNEYMAKADFMISKAGGITLFESIYSETPLFVIKPFLSQEINNAKFIEENRIGDVIWEEREDLVDSIIDLVHNESKLNTMKERMKQIKEQAIENELVDVINYIKSGAIENENTNHYNTHNYNYSLVI